MNIKKILCLSLYMLSVNCFAVMEAVQILVTIDNMTSNKVVEVSITSNDTTEVISNIPPGKSSGSSISGDTVANIECTLLDGTQITLNGAPFPFSAGSVRIQAHGSGAVDNPYVCDYV